MISAITSRFTRSSLVSHLSATVTAVSSLLTALRICGARKEKTAITESSHSIFAIKPVLRITLGFALLASVMLIFLSIGFLRSLILSKGVSEAKSKGVTQANSNSSHILAAPYYSIKGGLKATLMISNQGPNQMPVQVRLFSRYGHQVDLPAMNLNGQEIKSLDLGQHVSPGTSFEEGSVQVEYQGRKLELGGVVTIVEATQGVIFDEELVEPAREFASSRLEGVWWRPNGGAEIRLALSNTSSSPLSITVASSGIRQGTSDSMTVTLGAHQTQVLSTKSDNESERLSLRGAAGGISITHSGPPGAAIAYGFVQEPSEGFSNVIDFSDPQKAKSTRLDGAGLRVGTIAGQQLSLIAVVRNVSSAPTVVNGRIPYTLSDGSQGMADIEGFPLAPGEVRRINLLPTISQETRIKKIESAGLEFTYTGEPGALIASALSMSSSRAHVYRVPMRDAT